MTAAEILRDVEEGNIGLLYFLYGPESFYRIEIVHALTHKLITPENRDFNLESFEARESAPGDWIGAAQTLSFMGGTKLVIVRNLHEAVLDDAGTKLLLEYVADPAPGSCLALTADKADRKRKLYKTLTAGKGAVVCEAPREAGLIPWVKRRARSMGYELKPEAARKMVERVGPKLGILAQELEKVITYAGKSKTVTGAMVGELVGEIKMENAFALTEALKEKKSEKALRLLHNQLDHGEDPTKILGLIAWQFRTLWEVKHYQARKLTPRKIAEQMGAKPFLVEKALQYTKNFSREALKNGLRNLFEADRELKTSGKDPQGVLESLLLRLCSSQS
ncbi:DNA polymerase III subunit delta [Candidatus Nitromaritima sp. SCGC AAA799-A02]|nr:DNA polymerase III subunit delta [Candidatus Nitromaritima sp. SCGC AAA799-A02]